MKHSKAKIVIVILLFVCSFAFSSTQSIADDKPAYPIVPTTDISDNNITFYSITP